MGAIQKQLRALANAHASSSSLQRLPGAFPWLSFGASASLPDAALRFWAPATLLQVLSLRSTPCFLAAHAGSGMLYLRFSTAISRCIHYHNHTIRRVDALLNGLHSVAAGIHIASSLTGDPQSSLQHPPAHHLIMPVPPAQALQLMSGDLGQHAAVKAYALRSLLTCPPEQVLPTAADRHLAPRFGKRLPAWSATPAQCLACRCGKAVLHTQPTSAALRACLYSSVVSIA